MHKYKATINIEVHIPAYDLLEADKLLNNSATQFHLVDQSEGEVLELPIINQQQYIIGVVE